MLIPRLDAMASHAARQFTDHKCPPREFCADPSLKGEGDRCRARERQRRTWNLFLRLARLDQGVLLKVSLEAALPVPIRLSFPGKERPEDVVHFVMDASGTSCFILDLATARYIYEEFTPEEQALFNKFEEKGEDAVTIIDSIIEKHSWYGGELPLLEPPMPTS